MKKLFAIVIVFGVFGSLHLSWATEPAFPGMNAPFQDMSTAPRYNVTDSNAVLVGSWGYGPNYAVYVVPPYAFIGNGTILQILDVSNPSSPTLVGETNVPGVIWKIIVQGNYAFLMIKTRYGFDNPGVIAVNISDPQNPQVLENSFLWVNFPRSFSVQDSLVYVIDNSHLWIFGVKDPGNPILTNFVNLYPATLTDVTQNDSLLFISDKSNQQIFVFKMQSFNATIIDTIHLSHSPEAIFVLDSLLLAAEGVYGIEIVNIANPTAFTLLGSVNTDGHAADVFAIGNLAFVADIWDGVVIIDIHNPNTPQIIAQMDTYTHNSLGNGTNAVFATGTQVFACDWFNGFHIFDVSDPSNPTELSFYPTASWAYDVYIENNRAYLLDGAYGLTVFDISNPAHPTEINHLNPTEWNYCHGLDVYGKYIFIANGWGGVRIVDKDLMQEVASIPVSGYLYNVTVSADGKYLYVPGGDAGFQIYDISNIQNPTLLGVLPTPGGSSFFHVVVYQQVAFLSDYNGRYFAVDISNPNNPAILDTLKTSDYGGNMLALKYPYLYAADGDSGVRIIDVSDPSNMHVVHSITLYDWAQYVGVFGNLLVVGDELSHGVLVYDITDPVNPKLLSFYRTIGIVYNAKISGQYLYVAAANSGFYIIDISQIVKIPPTETNNAISEFHLHQNFPNPFNGTTVIRYTLPQSGQVEISIYNTLGQKIRTIVQGKQSTGLHHVMWNGKDDKGQKVPSGIYFYQLRLITKNGSQISQTRKMMLLQ